MSRFLPSRLPLYVAWYDEISWPDVPPRSKGHKKRAIRRRTGSVSVRCPETSSQYLEKPSRLTAVPVNIDPCVLASGHETVFEGSQIQGALGRRCRYTQGAGRQDLLGVDAHHKTLAKEERETGDVQPKAIPGRPSRKGTLLKGWLPKHLRGQRRSHPGRAQRGFRGALRAEGLHLHRGEGHLRVARWRLAAQKKSQIASERDEEVRGLWRWLASRFDARRLVFVDEIRLSHLHDAPESESPEREEGLRQGPREPRQEHHPHRRHHPPREPWAPP